MITKDQIKIGDRLQYMWNGKDFTATYGCVLEVVSIEKRGAVCDATYPRNDGSGKYRNVGHRALYEYDKLRKL